MASPKKKSDPPQTPADAIPISTPTKLRKLVIQNFGCIGTSPVEVELDDIVVLVGPNNSGKSTILRAYQTITGSAAPKLEIDDFHGGMANSAKLPTIELVTAVGEELPGSRWIQKVDGENIVRERWSWKEPGAEAIRQGWDVGTSSWSENVPWGAANVANSRRPVPHRIEAFANPSDQINEVTTMLLKVLQSRLKGRQAEVMGEDGKPQKTSFGELLDALAQTQKAVVQEAKSEIEQVENQLTAFVNPIFKGYQVRFDARPEEDLLKSLNFFKAGTVLQMGPKDGHFSVADRQGSGARRTLMWAALRYIAESTKKGEAGPAHLLLLDEPELCLHPNAIRECCSTLYQLPETKKWQVMVTTHSPAFIDLSRDNTTVVRVERGADGAIRGTTVFRPTRAKLDLDEKRELKLLNLYDPQVAEFFFGGSTILVEGDTEYTAFKHVVAEEPSPNAFTDLHIVRARGKVTISLLARLLNQFGARYSVLHDSDTPCTTTRAGRAMVNPAWTNNQKILDEVKRAPDTRRVRLIAALTNFEKAMFDTEVDQDKPYNAYKTLKENTDARARARELLCALTNFSGPVPKGFLEWSDLHQLQTAIPDKRNGAADPTLVALPLVDK
jgi:putative ATP-dependent endonuclease of OLD family